MKQTRLTKSLSIIVCVVLMAAMALFASGCTDKPTTPATDAVISTAIGEGATVFAFQAVMPDGTVKAYDVHTDEETVGAALLAVGLIAGEDSAYGLYVKTVDGVTLDYNTDGKYWAFYVDGEYAVSGVDTTTITPGATYAFQAE